MTRFGNFSIHEGDSTVRSYSLGTDACDMAQILAKRGRIAADIETAGLAEKSYIVKAIIVASDTHTAILDGFNPKHVQAARDAFDACTSIGFHNSPFDVPPLVNCGAMTLDHIWKVTDTLIWANMALSGKLGGKGLGDLEKSILMASGGQAEKDRFEQWAKINKYKKSEAFERASYSDRAYAMYAGHDGIITHRLHDPLRQMVIDRYTNHPFGRYGADLELAEYLVEREQIVNRVMLRRSAKGLGVDDVLLQREQDRICEEQADLAESMRGFGIESPTNANHLINALLKDDAIPAGYPVTGKKGLPSTAGDNLKKLKHPAADLYHRYYDLNKLFSNYENARSIAANSDGRLHPVVGVMKAVTGRMTYSNPGLHSFDPVAREAILGDKDLTSLDFSQIEPVMGANLSGDIDALEVYEGSGDLYQAAVQAGGVDRDQGKVVILAGMFGQGLTALAAGLKVDSLEEAEEIRREVNKGMPRTGNLIGWATEWAGEFGLTFTMSGRIIEVPEGFDYRGMNYTIQPSAYDVMAENIVEAKKRGISDELHLVVHDEFVVSTEAAEEMRDIMMTPPPRLEELIGRTPIFRTDRADLGDRWRTPPKKCPCGGSTHNWGKHDWVCG